MIEDLMQNFNGILAGDGFSGAAGAFEYVLHLPNVRDLVLPVAAENVEDLGVSR